MLCICPLQLRPCQVQLCLLHLERGHKLLPLGLKHIVMEELLDARIAHWDAKLMR